MAKKLHLTPIHKSFIYFALAAAAVMIFRFIVPGADLPVGPYITKWRLLRGLLTLSGLFPALALSAFVVPFGYRIKDEEDMVFVPGKTGSLSGVVIRSVVNACIYAAILFFITPFTEDTLKEIEAYTALYRNSRAEIRALLVKGGVLAPKELTASGLSEAIHLLVVAERIWPDSNLLAAEKSAILSERERRGLVSEPAEELPSSMKAFVGQRQPVNAAEALRFANNAMNGQRYFDAHWLAGLAQRLATEGTVERSAAARLAAQAWALIEQFEPKPGEIRARDNYMLKLSGYEAMSASDWIRAYYIFLELKLLTPNDPDLDKFIAKCKEGIASVAFFLDELETASNLMKTEAVFSIPRVDSGGRVVFRAGTLSLFSDIAYALNIEIEAFDAAQNPLYRVTAPYAKILPVTIGGRARSVVYMRALDRNDKNLRWEPHWQNSGGTDAPADLLLDISYEDFYLAANIDIPDTSYRFTQLHSAAARLQDYGFVPEVFSALEIRSVSEPLLLLPLSVFAAIAGFRYRVRQIRARYVLVPMLIILPVVFNAFVQLCRHLNNLLAVWTALNLNFIAAVTVCAAVSAGLFVIALVLLAYQKQE